jgi:AcrR family transcriptional regulator
MKSDAVPRRAPGRPLEARPRRLAIEATLDLIAERGLRALTTDAVARRAGISKATMYRRWPSKDALVVDAVSSLVSEVAIPDTGTLREDVRALLRDSVALYAGSRPAKLIPDLVAEMARTPAVADAVRTGFLAQRRDALRRVLDRARKRGELRDRVDDELCIDLLVAVIQYRLLISGGPLTTRLADELTDALLHGIASSQPGAHLADLSSDG